MRNGYKEALRKAISKEFTEGEQNPFRADEIPEFAAKSLKKGKLTEKEIGQALRQGIMDAGGAETHEVPIKSEVLPKKRKGVYLI